jgi:hypothetical protein
MNIFFLHVDPVVAAQFQHDKHVVKMCLETAQILCTVYDRFGLRGPYKATHPRHPSVLWAGDSLGHYRWLVRHGLALCQEYTHRFGKRHASQSVIEAVELPPVGIADNGFVPPYPAMPAEFIVENDSLASYRAYYLDRKINQSRWTRRSEPPFVKDHIMAKKAKKTETQSAETPTAETPTAETPTAEKSPVPSGISLQSVITVLSEKNPKREGSKARSVFAQYITGDTVAATLERCGELKSYAGACMAYDASHGFISISGYDPKAPKARPVSEKKAKKVEATNAAAAALAADAANPESSAGLGAAEAGEAKADAGAEEEAMS